MAGIKVLNTFKTYSVEETINVAFKFAGSVSGGSVIILTGPVGSGKTTFLNGIAKYIGCNKDVISSSFKLMSFYKGKRFNLVHFDFYRVGGKFALEEIVEYVNDKNILSIEWPYEINKYLFLKPYLVDIKFKKINEREIKIKKYE